MNTIIMMLDIDPPTITAQQKGVRVVHGRPFFYEKHEVTQARRTIEWAMKKYVPDEPIETPVRLTVKLGIPTKDKRKIRKGWKDTRPDLDNMLKLMLDCLTEMSFLKDDALIVQLVAEKKWAENGYIFIVIEDAR
jgi:Holliday junction resolvase RusA-like endonuclease